VGLRVDQLEESIAARVAGVDAAPYDQRGSGSAVAAPAFIEADSPLVPQGEARPLGHLRYSVLCESAPVVDDRQNPGTYAKCVADVVVQFLYRLRPGSQRGDQRLAAQAAASVVRAIKAIPQHEWSAAIVNAWAPTISVDGEWLLVALTFAVVFDIPV